MSAKSYKTKYHDCRTCDNVGNVPDEHQERYQSELEVADLEPEDAGKVEKFLQEIIEKTKLPGISVAMSVKGQPLYACAGVADVETQKPITVETYFELGCLNKLLVAIVVLELVNEGFIELEQHLSFYLPELAGANGDAITIKHLLCHTAGYQGDNMFDPDVLFDYSYETFVGGFNRRPMLFEPGTVFDYNHANAVLLAKVVEKVTQLRFDDILQARILDPLNIQTITAAQEADNIIASSHASNPMVGAYKKIESVIFCEFWKYSLGGPWIAPHDLLKLSRAIDKSHGLFSSSTLGRLLTPATKLPGMFPTINAEQPFFIRTLGCAQYATGSYGVASTSTGQCCALRFDPEKQISIVVSINAAAPHVRDIVLNKLFNSMLPDDAPEREDLTTPVQIDFDLEELTGTYQGALHNRFELKLEQGVLDLCMGHNPAASYDSAQVLLSFVKNKQGHLVPKMEPAPVVIGFFRGASNEHKIGLRIGINSYQKLNIR